MACILQVQSKPYNRQPKSLMPVSWESAACLVLQAFKQAKEVADAELAQRKGPVKLASIDEIRRVLEAKTDHDCLQVSHQPSLSLHQMQDR